MRLAGDLVAGIKWHIRPDTSPHPHAGSLRPGEIHRTCKTHWKTTQDNQDRSTDHEGAPQPMTPILTPDTIMIHPAGPDITDYTQSDYAVT